MQIVIPPVAAIRQKLRAMSQTQLKKVADDSGVPFGTLMHIRHGATENPGIETVRAFYPFLPQQ